MAYELASCPHLEAIASSPTSLETLCRHYLSILYLFVLDSKRSGLKDRKCFECESMTDKDQSTFASICMYSRRFACLFCIYVACHPPSNSHPHGHCGKNPSKETTLGTDQSLQSHAISHCKRECIEGGYMHKVFLDVTESSTLGSTHAGQVLYCIGCSKYMLLALPWMTSRPDKSDPAFVLRTLSTLFSTLNQYKHLTRSVQEKVQKHWLAVDTRPNTSSEAVNYYQIRGLYNLGHTCFMNAILQVCLHIPYFQEFFLSNLHSHYTQCSLRRIQQYCSICDLEDIFRQFWTISLKSENSTNQRKPIAPVKQLHSMWSANRELASYGQHDAHEFFIALMNQLHVHLQGTPSDCTCMIHEIFCGYLESNVTCLRCGSASSIIDPFIDLSLDMTPTSNDQQSINLMDKILKFIQPEKLGIGSGYVCSNCSQESEGCIKQLCMHLLPPILCFHMKRFEQHVPNSNGFRKIDSRLIFPHQMDMSAYVSSSLSVSMDDNLQNFTDTKSPMIYELFAVVIHQGISIESGHYISYVLADPTKRLWYKMEDAWITQSSISTVLHTNPYMLFYINISKLDSCIPLNSTMDPLSIN
jgi:ubiquitin C-terminal hydrolase